MPHKEGHWGYKTRKKIQNKVGEVASNIGNKAKLVIKKTGKTIENVNPNSTINKKIKKKKSEIASGNVKAKSQLSALKRKKSGKTIAQVKAENKAKMQANAKKRNEQFKKTGKSTVEQRRADAKKRIQDAARKRNEAFKKRRAKK